MKNTKKYSFDEAIKMLKNKKGAGVAKHTRIKLDVDIEFDSGKPGAKILIETLSSILPALIIHDSQFTGYSRKNVEINDHSFVQTELEDNPKSDYEMA